MPAPGQLLRNPILTCHNGTYARLRLTDAAYLTVRKRRKAAIPWLKAIQSQADFHTREDARDTIDAITSRNHKFFVTENTRVTCF